MNRQLQTQQKAAFTSTASFTPAQSGLLQRKCACGNHTVAGGECAACAQKKSGLQRKLAIGASNDPLEREADRVADQVLAAPAHSTVSDAPPRIQRYAGQATGEVDTAPASVDRVLASSGRPLEPALQQDMGQRFGHDFSRVRVHSGTAAEQSAREVNAHAFTVGHNMVFGAGWFAPGTHEGRRLIAHELTHVVQQSSAQSGVRNIQREAASKAGHSTGNLYLDVVLDNLVAPGLEPDYVDALALLDSLSMQGILDILFDLKQRGLLKGLLDHYADNQGIFVLRVYIAMQAVLESGTTTRNHFQSKNGYILEKLPPDQQSLILDKVGANKGEGSPKRAAAPQQGQLYATSTLQEGPALDQGGKYAGPSIGPSNEPYGRRHRYIRIPVDDPLQYELIEFWGTAEEAEEKQKQVDMQEGSDRAFAALAAGSSVSRGSANPTVPGAPVIPGSIAGKPATYRTGPTPAGKASTAVAPSVATGAPVPAEFPKVAGAAPGSHANDTLPPGVTPIRQPRPLEGPPIAVAAGQDFKPPQPVRTPAVSGISERDDKAVGSANKTPSSTKTSPPAPSVGATPTITAPPSNTPQRSGPRFERSQFDQHREYRDKLGLPPAGSPDDKATIARFVHSSGEEFMGINAHGQTGSLKINAISKTHAEADVFIQAQKKGVSGGYGTLYVDRELCVACGEKSAIQNMANQLKLERLVVIGPESKTIMNDLTPRKK
jgi:hypothetical protein